MPFHSQGAGLPLGNPAAAGGNETNPSIRWGIEGLFAEAIRSKKVESMSQVFAQYEARSSIVETGSIDTQTWHTLESRVMDIT